MKWTRALGILIFTSMEEIVPNFFRIMVIIGLVTLIPALVVLWQQIMPPSAKTTPPTDSSPISNKMFGTSALSHGGPTTVPSVPNQVVADQGDFELGQTVSFRKEEASRPTNVVIVKRDVRRLPDGQVEDRYEVQFADGATVWANKQSLRMSDQRNERSTKER